MYNGTTDLISIEELCSILLIGRNKAYELLNNKKIKAFRIGKTWKIPRLSVDEFILSESGFNKKTD